MPESGVELIGRRKVLTLQMVKHWRPLVASEPAGGRAHRSGKPSSEPEHDAAPGRRRRHRPGELDDRSDRDRAPCRGSGNRRFPSCAARAPAPASGGRPARRPRRRSVSSRRPDPSSSDTLPRFATATARVRPLAKRRTRTRPSESRRTTTPGTRTSTTTPSRSATATRPTSAGRVARTMSAAWSPGAACSRQWGSDRERDGCARGQPELPWPDDEPGRRASRDTAPGDPGPAAEVERIARRPGGDDHGTRTGVRHPQRARGRRPPPARGSVTPTATPAGPAPATAPRSGPVAGPNASTAAVAAEPKAGRSLTGRSP